MKRRMKGPLIRSLIVFVDEASILDYASDCIAEYYNEVNEHGVVENIDQEKITIEQYLKERNLCLIHKKYDPDTARLEIRVSGNRNDKSNSQN